MPFDLYEGARPAPRGRWLAVVETENEAARVAKRRPVHVAPANVCDGYPLDRVDAEGRIVPHRDSRWPGRWLPDEEGAT